MPNLLPPFKINQEYFDHELNSRSYNRYHPKTIPSRKYEHIEISEDGCVFRLNDKVQGDIVSFIFVKELKLSKSSFLEIKATRSTYPRRKFLSYLFDLLLEEFNHKIISDEIHTSPGSKEFWLSIGRKRKYDIYTINIKSNYKRKYSSYSDHEIWGLSNEISNQLSLSIGLFDQTSSTIFENEHIELELIEIEGSEDIDMLIIKESSTSKEILDFFKMNKNNISCKKHIRLVAQKT